MGMEEIGENGNGNGSSSSVLIELPLGDAAETFDLEKAICSHGLFMMPPNQWDPVSRSLSRPLRLLHHSLMVRISQPQYPPRCLHVRVYGTRSLSPQHQHSLLDQVKRMLRLSDSEEKKVNEFRKIVEAVGGEEAEFLSSFSGRVFRSPTLFEDMVKCILLCNCQWPRTLSMAKALCELQLELHQQSSSFEVAEAGRKTQCSTIVEANGMDFIPKTPLGKELKRKHRISGASTKLTRMLVQNQQTKADAESHSDLAINSEKINTENLTPSFLPIEVEAEHALGENLRCFQTLDETGEDNLQFAHGMESNVCKQFGNFPSPKELANLDENFLAKRCSLGYRAGRILKLARGIVEGRIQLTQLEEVCKEASLSSYGMLAAQLSQLDGFGPFTCANVLMCMGFYHVIPTDSETLRHLKQVHARKSTIQTVERDVEVIYGKYAPFQFLAYWAELWNFYEQRFGRLSQLPPSDYKLITASNMRMKAIHKTKRGKASSVKLA
ncbi:hypothetical protein SLE2022_086050 [Rubroshorea leprosula]